MSMLLAGTPAAAAARNPIPFRTASMVATIAVAIGMSAFGAYAFNATPANIIPVRQAALVKELPTVPVQPQYGRVMPFVSETGAFISIRQAVQVQPDPLNPLPSFYGRVMPFGRTGAVISIRQAVQVQPDPLTLIPPTYGKVIPFVAGTQAVIPTRYGTWTPTERAGVRTSAFSDYVFNATTANIIPIRQAVQVQPDPLTLIPPTYGRVMPFVSGTGAFISIRQAVQVQPDPLNLIPPTYGKVIPFVAGTQAVIPTRYGTWTPTERAGVRTSAFSDYVFNATTANIIPIRQAVQVQPDPLTLIPPTYGKVIPFAGTQAAIPIRQQNPSLGVPGRLINSIYWNETLYYHYRPHIPIQVRRLEELRVEPRLVRPQVLPFPYWTPPPPANPVIPIWSRRLSELELPAPLIVVGYYGLTIHHNPAESMTWYYIPHTVRNSC